MRGVRRRRCAALVGALLCGTAATLAAPGGHAAAATTVPWGWGWNSQGQVGDGTNGDELSPVPVQGGLSGVVSLSAGGEHSLAAQSDGTVWAWGGNFSHQLGTGVYNNSGYSNVPVQVPGVAGVIQVAAGYNHSLALESDGTVWAWGDNQGYELAQPGQFDSVSPVQVQGVSNVTAIAAGDAFSLALESDGTVWEWGVDLPPAGQTPVQVGGLGNVTSITAGWGSALAITADGTLWAWGSNYGGQLGTGDETDRSVPVQVGGLSGVVAAAIGSDHALAVTADGTAWSWGNNSLGQLGNGTVATSGCYCIPTPEPVPGITAVTRVAAGADHSLALTSDGRIWGWGRNSEGEVGNNSTQSPVTSPVPLWSVDGAVLITAFNHHSLALGLPGGPAPPPAAPPGLTASPGATLGAVDLSWGVPSTPIGAPIQSYLVYRSTSSGSETLLATVPAWATHYTDTTAKPLTTYYYEVAATNPAVGPLSNEACAVAYPWHSALGCSVP